MPPLQSLLRYPPTRRTAAAAATAADAGFKWVRDHGLDHAAERENNLIPLINTKNFIISEPSKSLPLSAIAERRSSLRIRTRPVEFLRRYPSVFREFFPDGPAAPHFGLTDEALELHSEEQIMYGGEDYRRDVAERLLKLLMLCRSNRLPLSVIHRLCWDLGLPKDYERSLVSEFPDYFRVTAVKGSGQDPRVLELVCWIDELGTSVMEKKAKGAAIVFPTQYSRDFLMDKQFKKFVEDWQKLPYVSPYEKADHISSKSDEYNKWAVAVLHEFLHILVPKKTEKENVLWLGECLGLRGRFKKAILEHPGIFYLSNRYYTYTLVLKEGYKRGALVEKHPLMTMRGKYIHLMNAPKEVVRVPGGSGNAEKKKQASSDAKDEGEEGNGEELFGLSDAEEEDEDEGRRGNGRRRREMDLKVKGSGGDRKRGAERKARSPERGRSDEGEESNGEDLFDSSDSEEEDEDEGRRGSGRRRRREVDSEVKGQVRSSKRGAERKARSRESGRSDGKHRGKSRERVPRKLVLGTEKQDVQLRGRSRFCKSKESSVPDETLS